MSFWSDIYVGNADNIARALEEGDLPEAESFVAHLNLPGILPSDEEEVPNSPNLLTMIACDVMREANVSFSDSIAQHLAGDPDQRTATYGVYRMASEWVGLFARLSEAQISAIGEEWAKRVDAPGNGSLSKVVKDIVEICRVATQRNAALVYSWTL